VAESKIRYEVIRRADLYDDQKPATQILTAEGLSLTQEEYQEYILSQIKRIIHRDNPGIWKDDFGAAGVLSLEELTAAVGTGQHLMLDFSWADVPTSPKLVGTVKAGSLAERVSMIIFTGFDQPVSLEVGRLLAPAELMLGTDSNPSIPDVYQVTPELVYAADTDVYLTLIAPGLPPTTGTGRVIVYLN
jgi:hypothetical protein